MKIKMILYKVICFLEMTTFSRVAKYFFELYWGYNVS